MFLVSAEEKHALRKMGERASAARGFKGGREGSPESPKDSGSPRALGCSPCHLAQPWVTPRHLCPAVLPDLELLEARVPQTS